MKIIRTLAFLLVGLGVAFGAFGAHGLKDYFIGREEEIWKTAVFYQIIHSLALLLIVVFEKCQILTRKISITSARLMTAGIFIFSGSLYLMVLTRANWLGAITPIGGVLLIASWFVLAWSSFRSELV